jgi:hypothetical protein
MKEQKMQNLQIQAAAILELQKRYKKRNESYTTRMEHYKTHPLEYFVERLGVDDKSINWELLPEYKNTFKWDGTNNPYMKALNAIVNGKWVGIESGTGVGKTFFLACLALWFLECFPQSLVITTAPKQDQLKLHIWKEIGNLYQRFNKGELIQQKLRMNPGKEDWIAVAFVAGVKATEESATKAQGFHAPDMLIIIEETPGVPEEIMTAFQNTSVSEHNLIIAVGNPDHQFDNLHKFCKMPNVEHIRISGFDYPNVVLNNADLIPGAQTVTGLNRMFDRYGDKEHPLYLSRARGISPMGSYNSAIKIEWCYKAVENYKKLCDEDGEINEAQIEGSRSLGVDVANSVAGDEAAICEGKGTVCLKIESFPCPNSNDLGDVVYRRMKDNGIELLQVDGVGVGAGTVNKLKEYGLADSINFQGAAKPIDLSYDVEKYNNLRSQAWWICRENLRKGNLSMPDDEELISDLVAPKYIVKNGKICFESKIDIKKRLGRSPNRGDAFVMWNWNMSARVISYGSVTPKTETEKQKPNYSSLTKRLGIK